MKAVILAGGKGSRLAHLTLESPKPMLIIGDKPVLHHQIELLVKYGLKEIFILVNYLKDPIIRYFGDGSSFDAKIEYFEEPIPLGTVGGIKEIENKLTEDFLVIYGDVMLNMDLSRLHRYHFEKQSSCTLVIHPNDHPYDSDLVETDESGKIVAFHSKPHAEGKWYNNMVNAGVYILSRDVLKYLRKGQKADFGRDVFPVVLNKMKLYGYHTSEYLKDMGTPDRLEKVKLDLASGRIQKSNLEIAQSAVFLDRDGVINSERSYISKPEELEVFDFAPSAIKKLNQKGLLTVVVTNQSAVARNLCTEEDIKMIHKKLETDLGVKNAWLDAIYYCPHHPDKGFPEENAVYKIECDCRKPRTGLFKKAIEKFNINPAISFMIGDSERDIQAGYNAGCTTIGVRTGYGLKKTRTMPDFMFENLAEAVDFIVEDPLKQDFLIVKQRYLKYIGEAPWIILIGGNARSGKSTLASYIRTEFRKAGKHVLNIALDNWLLAEGKRTPSMNVYERFRLDKIEEDISKLLNGQKINILSYSNHAQRDPYEVEYDPVNADIIVIEGVVALSSENIRKNSHLKIYTHITPLIFNDRINNYYRWRGNNSVEIADLIKKRKLDEYQLIEKESKLADMIINSSLS